VDPQILQIISKRPAKYTTSNNEMYAMCFQISSPIRKSVSANPYYGTSELFRARRTEKPLDTNRACYAWCLPLTRIWAVRARALRAAKRQRAFGVPPESKIARTEGYCWDFIKTILDATLTCNKLWVFCTRQKFAVILLSH